MHPGDDTIYQRLGSMCGGRGAENSVIPRTSQFRRRPAAGAALGALPSRLTCRKPRWLRSEEK
eukprot:6258859-Prymnesium_polylepis.2